MFSYENNAKGIHILIVLMVRKLHKREIKLQVRACVAFSVICVRGYNRDRINKSMWCYIRFGVFHFPGRRYIH